MCVPARKFLCAYASLLRRAHLLLLGLLVLAVLWLTTLGVLHGILHARMATSSDPVSVALPAHPAAAASTFVRHLLPHHTGDRACLLLDGVSHAGAAPALSEPFLPFVLPAAVLTLGAGEFCARSAALFDARGPPSSR
jgi:hypothetical protein